MSENKLLASTVPREFPPPPPSYLYNEGSLPLRASPVCFFRRPEANRTVGRGITSTYLPSPSPNVSPHASIISDSIIAVRLICRTMSPIACAQCVRAKPRHLGASQPTIGLRLTDDSLDLPLAKRAKIAFEPRATERRDGEERGTVRATTDGHPPLVETTDLSAAN